MASTYHGFEVFTGQRRLRAETKINLEALMGGGGEQMLEMMSAVYDMMVVGVAMAPDGRHLATAGLTSVKVWDVVRGRELRVLAGRGVVPMTVTFSPDGKLLLVGRLDGSIRLWDVATATVLGDLPLHGSTVTALAFSPDGKTLASGSADTTVLLWDWAALRQRLTAVSAAAAPEALWQALADEEGEKVRDALATLVAAPGPAVDLLRARMKPVPPVDPARVAKLLADLDSKQFAVRQAATKELEKLGDLAGPAIHQQLAGKPSPEARQRLETLRDRLDGTAPTAQLRREVRGVEALERIGTPEARELLEALARGGGAPADGGGGGGGAAAEEGDAVTGSGFFGFVSGFLFVP